MAVPKPEPRSAATLSPLEFQPYLHPVPFRYRIGATAIDSDDWILIDDQWADNLAEKRRVLDQHHGQTVCALDGSEAEAAEIFEELARHVAAQFPDLYRLDDGRIANAHTGESWSLTEPEIHPIEAAGRLVQEDLTLLAPRDDRLVMTCGCVAFPNRWDLASKIGRELSAIHAPVPTVNAELGTSIDSFIARLRPSRMFTRFAWGVAEDPALFQPPHAQPRPPSALSLEQIPAVMFRMERETLRRFPQHGSVLFTFRTYTRPLAWFRDRPNDARQLADAIRSMPDDIAAYKGLAASRSAIVDWLDATVASTTDRAASPDE